MKNPFIENYQDRLPNVRIRNALIVSVVLISALIRAFFAYSLELGNDEVYYWTYALYPDLSHFDHPPMVGFTIQAFSLDLYFQNELFVRMGSIILGAANTWLIFLIGKHIKDFLTGFYAALLYTASVYCFVIAGIFILPDTPQLFFWIVSLYMLLRSLPAQKIEKKNAMAFFFASIPMGLAMLSKYTSVFLWIGAVVYIIFYHRAWLRKSEFYLSILISLLIFSPAILWNIENKFISFTFQSERVSFFGQGLRPDLFFTEFVGQIIYNNPVNFGLIVLALLAVIKGKTFLSKEYLRILILTSLPLILLFLFFALFRRTLPHWSAPGYISLILLSAAFLSQKAATQNSFVLFPKIILASIAILFLALSVGFLEVNTGLLTNSSEDDPRMLGRNNITLDMYGWKQLNVKFSELYDADLFSKNINADAPIIAHRWFPAAHFDYYLAKPNNMNLIAIGSLEQIHKYAWINRQRPALRRGSDAYFITGSRDYKSPDYLLQYFAYIEKPETIRIFKGNRHVQNFFVYRLRYCLQLPPDVLEEFGVPQPAGLTHFSPTPDIN
jgi:hypothetical protein